MDSSGPSSSSSSMEDFFHPSFHKEVHGEVLTRAASSPMENKVFFSLFECVSEIKTLFERVSKIKTWLGFLRFLGIFIFPSFFHLFSEA